MTKKRLIFEDSVIADGLKPSTSIACSEFSDGIEGLGFLEQERLSLRKPKICVQERGRHEGAEVLFCVGSDGCG